jgi:hypothetical protein
MEPGRATNFAWIRFALRRLKNQTKEPDYLRKFMLITRYGLQDNIPAH